jgi:hypothetical protein
VQDGARGGDQSGEGTRCGPGGRGPGVRGTITAIEGATVTVEAGDGSSVTVTTTDTTKVAEATAGTVADIAAGDTIRVRGPEGDDGTVAARHIVEVPGTDAEEAPDGPPEGAPEGAPRRGVVGTVESVEGTTLTVTGADGETVTVTTSDDTEVVVVAARTVADLAVGDEVGVRGSVDDAGTVTAERILLGELPEMSHRRGGPRPDGAGPPDGGAGPDEAPAPDEGTGDDSVPPTTA